MIERVEIAGHEVEVLQVEGAGDGPTIVLLHEGLGCLSLWREFPQQLSEATGCDVVAWSRWGYGRSESRPTPWPFDYHEPEAVEAVPELLSAMAVGPHILWGHSDGATIALLNAGLSPAPGLRGVISVAGHVVVEQMSEMDRMAVWYAEGDLRERLARHHDDPDAVFGEWLRIWTSEEFAAWDIRPKVASVYPTLVLQGGDDRYAVDEHVDWIVDAVGPRAEGLLLDGAGHHPMFDSTTAVLALTARFIRAL